jgi:biotin synthase
VRRSGVGDAVHLRGLIEFSNECCRRECLYCGLRAGEPERAAVPHELPRGPRSAQRGRVELGYGTVVLQAGEDGGA